MGQLCAEGGEHERPVGGARDEAVEGGLQDLDPVGVDDTGSAEEPSVVREGGGDEPVGVAEVGGPACRVEERLTMVGVAGLALGGAEPDREVESEDRVGVGGLGVEVEGLGVVAERVGGSERGEGCVPGLARVVDRLGQVDGLGGAEPVTSELPHPCAGSIAEQVFESFGYLSVRASASSRAEVFVQGVLDQRVGEAVTARRTGQFAHQRHGRGRVEHVEEVVFRCLGRAGQDIEVEVPTDHGRHGEHAFGVWSESSDACADHFADAVGKRHLFEGGCRGPTSVGVLGDRPGLGEMDEHFAYKERVPVSLAMQRVRKTDRGVAETVAGSGLHECHDAGVVQAGELDTRHALLAAQRGQRVEERM